MHFTEAEKRVLINFLAENPVAGDEIPGTGGVRKVRFAASGRGKRGEARIIYYYLDDTMPLYAFLAYAKNKQGDTTPNEKRASSALTAALKPTRRKKG
jgi:mRNA-degrading endonuclease RelE of RelBE toxin-antitoxin system